MLNENFLERRREDDAKRQAGIGYDFYIAGILGYEKRKNKGADQLLGNDRTDVKSPRNSVLRLSDTPEAGIPT